jgi:uncharacterized iron-regulated protein
MRTILFIAGLSLMSFTLVSDKPAYRIFDPKGKESSYDNILKAAQGADVVLFGELHDNPICHWLQLQLTKDLYAVKKNNLILGAEMFEADDQVALDEYLHEKISEKTLKDEVKLWPNYKTDYKPLLDLAKSNHLPFVAANIPRRYANMVYLKGLGQLDSIDAEAKKWIAPLPIKYDASLKCYKDIYEAAGGHGGENLPKSQAVKDATMAYFILKSWSKGKTFIHYNGSYHSDYKQGIAWYLKQERPDLKIVVIASTEQDNISALDKESIDLGDFIICTPGDMTKTQ